MSRIDRRTALRRAAAPSVDLSLMPDAGAVQALLEAANRKRDEASSSSVSPETPPMTEAAPAKPPVSEAPIAALPAPEPSEHVPQRFRMRPRPTGHPTLQPLDPPIAAALQKLDPTEAELEAALAFVRAHRAAAPERSDRYERPAARKSQPPSTPNAPLPLGELPTLIHFTNDRTVEIPHAPAEPEGRPDTPLAEAARRPTRKAATTIRPSRAEPALTLTPNAEEKSFWDGAEDHVESRPSLFGEEDETLGEAVDPELDAYMVRRSRGRFITALGVSAAMLLLLAAAAGGVMVMAQPGVLQGTSEVTAPAPPPPPRPLRPMAPQ